MGSALPLAFVALALTGCLWVPAEREWAHPECRGKEMTLRGTVPGAWTNVTGASLWHAARGWPLPAIDGPVADANATRVLWRPDGKDPLAPDASTTSIQGDLYVSPVVYRMTMAEAGPEVSATYPRNATPEQVAADARQFAARVVHDGDGAAWAVSFSTTGTDSNPSPFVRHASGQVSGGAPAARTHTLAWDGGDVALRAVRLLRMESDWQGTSLRVGALAVQADVPTKFLRHEGASHYAQAFLDPFDDVSVRVVAGDVGNATREVAAFLAGRGMDVRGLEWRNMATSSWCNLDTGERYGR